MLDCLDHDHFLLYIPVVTLRWREGFAIVNHHLFVYTLFFFVTGQHLQQNPLAFVFSKYALAVSGYLRIEVATNLRFNNSTGLCSVFFHASNQFFAGEPMQWLCYGTNSKSIVNSSMQFPKMHVAVFSTSHPHNKNSQCRSLRMSSLVSDKEMHPKVCLITL